MKTDLKPTINGHTPGRALYIGRQGEIYIARKYAIYRSNDRGATWHLDCVVPSSGWQSLVAGSRLAARLLRRDVMALQILDDGARIAVARDGLYRAEPGETQMERVFRVTRGSRPVNLTVDGDRVLFGEYGIHLGWNREVYIYVSEDGGRNFDVGYRFPKADILHVHNILVDPYADHYWVLAGDFGRQPGIAMLSKDMTTLEWLQRGSQLFRVMRAFVEPDCLIYGTDSDRERNYIVRVDKQSGRVDELKEVEGSSLYAASFGPIRIISTCVEKSPVCTSRECSLYASTDGDSWQSVVRHQKDRYSFYFFQLGTLVLPYAHHNEPWGIYSGQAVAAVDDKVSLLEFTPPGRTSP